MNIPRILNNAGLGRHGLASGEELHASFLFWNYITNCIYQTIFNYYTKPLFYNVLSRTHAILHEICGLMFYGFKRHDGSEPYY